VGSERNGSSARHLSFHRRLAWQADRLPKPEALAALGVVANGYY
jgi:hypothetical protein